MLPSIDTTRYAELFRTEAGEHLTELESALLLLEQRDASGAADTGAGASVDADRDAGLATLFRATHTIKGMAASMGYRAVERLSHALESLLDSVREGKLPLSRDIVALLFDGTDILAETVAETGRGVDDPDRPSLRALLQRLEGVMASEQPLAPSIDDVFGSIVTLDDGMRLGSAGFEDAVGRAAGDLSSAPPTRVRRTIGVTLARDCPLKGVRALLVLGRLERLGTIRELSPSQERWHDDSFDGAFTVALESAASPDGLEEAARAAGDVASVEIRADDSIAPERSRETMRHVRIDLRRLDTLLDLMGELVITRDRLLRETEQAMEQGADRALSRVAHDMARLLGSLQDEVLQARMVPVGQVFDRFPRLVRDLSRDLGKDVHFVMEGRGIELDRSLLEAIGDPVLHLLRNALDHGLEDAESRRASGKSPTGRLVLRAARDRAAIVIQVEDDGRGIDRNAVLRRAVEKGLVGHDEFDDPSHFDDDRLLQTLAHSGLSTARAVTSISGRGVGVDVVATRVRALGGLLSLETIKGVGTVFTMRLPATLAITRALLVRVADATYAIPATHVVEALEYDPAMRREQDGREALRVREETLPVLRLRQKFGCPAGDGEGYVAIVEAAGRRCALVVDGMIAQQDVVVKPFDAVRGGAPWFSGATVLGDGTPSLIVDLGSLI